MINSFFELLDYLGTGMFFGDFLTFIQNATNYLVNPDFPIWLLLIKYAFILISILFAGFIIYVAFSTGWMKLRYLNTFLEFLTFRPIGAVRVEKRWNQIASRVEEGATESDYKLSIMEAETMLNDILEEMGYSGETLEERLDQLALGAISNKKRLLEVHEIRNSIARDPDYEIDLDKAQEVLNVFEQALRDLQAF